MPGVIGSPAESSRKNVEMAKDFKLVNSSPLESFCENVEIAKTSNSFVRPQRRREGQKISAIMSN